MVKFLNQLYLNLLDRRALEAANHATQTSLRVHKLYGPQCLHVAWSLLNCLASTQVLVLHWKFYLAFCRRVR